MNFSTSSNTMILSGLTIGKRYEVRLYHRPWDPNVTRRTTIVFDPDGAGPISDAVTFNPDKMSANYLGYSYLAVTNRLLITYQSLTADTYHMYGLSNEEAYDTLGNPVALSVSGADVFNGTLTGQGALVKSGSGSFTVTGTSTANGPVAVSAGAFGVANSGTATLGPVSVASGATLFGDGRVGGNVSVASNAWIMAGTASACGTLQAGGNLALAQGARIAWRYSASACDTFVVGGQLSFPTNGTVAASPLSNGSFPPSKQSLISSSQVIDGPGNLRGWNVTGPHYFFLVYSGDHKVIYICQPGTLILVQ
jgi:autotransporter-associated beta strand protein